MNEKVAQMPGIDRIDALLGRRRGNLFVEVRGAIAGEKAGQEHRQE